MNPEAALAQRGGILRLVRIRLNRGAWQAELRISEAVLIITRKTIKVVLVVLEYLESDGA
jgi:hypothetical protein